ncbi:MAG TPA: alkaline phosphatase family protein [Burkholderiales bacterium]
MMHKPRLKKISAAISVGLMLAGPFQTISLAYAHNGDRDDRHEARRTETPIEHLIVVIPENRSFDHTFATYRARHGQMVSNLLGKGIVRADGTPGPNFGLGAQFTVPAQTSFYIGAPAKTPYTVLPAPDTSGTPTAPRDTAPPFTSLAIAAIERDLEPADLVLLTTGASGLPARSVDTRVTNAANLPNGPFQLTGPTMPYDAYTGDTIHRLYQMWQQSDCSLVNATHHNPSGCLNDLYPFVNTTFNTSDNGVGNSMAILNMNDGDAPLFKRLADEFAMSDNFHQSVMGGTAANHVMLGTGDAVYFSDGNGNALAPAATLVANPNPRPGTNNRYTVDGNWANCSDNAQPGVAPVTSYLASLPYSPAPNCEPGHFYMINNINPGFLPNGQPRTTGNFVPPSTRRTIGDALSDKGISWAYFGGAYNAAVNLANGSTNPADAVGAAYCQICNPFQYSKSIMGDPLQRAMHVKDTADLLAGIRGNTLPAVSFAKPDGLLDGHPQSSKLGLFEAYLKNILDTLDGNPRLKAKTAVFVVFDEGGGYWDSGFLQPLDFFGDGPRIPFLAISEFSRGGHVSHGYTDHVSILKFIERNWRLAPLTARSRDNLPNPRARWDNPYVPVNMPAIGDLFDLFHFDDEHGERRFEDGHGER